MVLCVRLYELTLSAQYGPCCDSIISTIASIYFFLVHYTNDTTNEFDSEKNLTIFNWTKGRSHRRRDDGFPMMFSSRIFFHVRICVGFLIHTTGTPLKATGIKIKIYFYLQQTKLIRISKKKMRMFSSKKDRHLLTTNW